MGTVTATASRECSGGQHRALLSAARRNPARDFSSTGCFLEDLVSKGSQERSQESPAAAWHSWARPSGGSEDRPVRAWVCSRLSREKFYLTVQMSIPRAICKQRFPSSLSKSW